MCNQKNVYFLLLGIKSYVCIFKLIKQVVQIFYILNKFLGMFIPVLKSLSINSIIFVISSLLILAFFPDYVLYFSAFHMSINF